MTVECYNSVWLCTDICDFVANVDFVADITWEIPESKIGGTTLILYFCHFLAYRSSVLATNDEFILMEA